MNQPRQIFANTAALALADAVQRSGSIVLALLIARLTNASGLGVYFGAVAYFSLIAVTGGLGATSFLVREIARDRTRTSYYISHMSVMGIVVSMAIAALFFAALPYLGYSADLATGITIVLIAVPAAVVKTLLRSVFIAHQKTGFVACAVIASTIANLCINVYLMMHGYGVVSFLVVLVVQEYASLALYGFLIHRYVAGLSWQFRPAESLKLAGQVKSFAALSIMGAIFANPEVILISILRDEAELGLYIAALKIVNLWLLLPQVFMTNVFPLLSRSYQESGQRFRFIQDKSIKYLLLVCLPLTVGTFVAAKPLIDLLYGFGFDMSVVVLQILVWSVPIRALMEILWRVLAAGNQQALDLRAHVISDLVRVSGGYLLILSLGLLGAAITVPISLLLQMSLLIRYVKYDSATTQFIRPGWRCAAAATGMGVVTWLLREELTLGALVLMAVVVYTVLIFAFKALSREDLAILRRIWQPATVQET